MKNIMLVVGTALLALFGIAVLITQNSFYMNLYVSISVLLLLAVAVGGAIEIQRKSEERIESKDIAAFNSFIQQRNKSL